MFKLTGKQLYLLPFQEEHLHNMRYYEWLQDPDIMKTINRFEYLMPIRFEAIRDYCENLWRSKTDLFFAIHLVDADTFIGTARVSQIDWHSRTADVGIMIGEKQVWGKGYASDAISTLCHYLFDTLDIRKITAGAMAVNGSMIKVFEKQGFIQEGVRRSQDKWEQGYCDHILLGCFRDEFNKDSK